MLDSAGSMSSSRQTQQGPEVEHGDSPIVVEDEPLDEDDRAGVVRCWYGILYDGAMDHFTHDETNLH